MNHKGFEVLRDMIHPYARKWIYAVYAICGVVLGVLAIVYGDPVWLDKAQEVYAYLGVPVGAIAVANVTPHALVTTAEPVQQDTLPKE